MNFAPYASNDFNLRFEETLRRLSNDVRSALRGNLVALILGGGYGRCEGAVVRREGNETAYNDVDLALVVRDALRINHRALQRVVHHYGDELKVHVDLSRPLTVRDIRRWSCCMMWHDLAQRHVVLTGPPNLIEVHAPRLVYQPLPLIEATRLLLNRGAGLLWAKRVARGVEPAPDADFIRRNYYKLALALGDAVLIAYQRFTTTYHGRDQTLQQLHTEYDEVAHFALQATYETALRFKLFPDDLPADQPGLAELDALSRTLGRVLLWVENRRSTHSHWQNLDDYAASTDLREPPQHRLPLLPRNLLHNLLHGNVAWRYPRERLYRELPMLLEQTSRRYRHNEWARDSERFLRLWKRYN